MVRTHSEIPLNQPATPLLDRVHAPADLRRLPPEQLELLADELRAYLLYAIGQTGGHFGAGLGVVELTVALHYLFNTPDDRLVWDVGHQTYPHKILTGRRGQLLHIRQHDGISGFPKRSESSYDAFGVGHSSTSVSAALGMALGAAMAGSKRSVVAIIGDGAMTAGQAFEALNHAASTHANLLVILNDNAMAIDHSVGGLANFFAHTRATTAEAATPGSFFRALGFHYAGPVDGHDLPGLLAAIRAMQALDGPRLLHVHTVKGKGFLPAELDPVGYHAINKIEPAGTVKPAASPKYQQIFGDWLCDEAAQDARLVAITPAMAEGSGMIPFSQRFPDRFHDVAICEQHAVTLAAGLACEGQKPVVAIYSTFLQRGYDQLIHDVALQQLDVTFGIDRAGIVGEDGATHGGVFDIGFLRELPHLVLATPSDENECRQLLHTCYQFAGPAAVRYPRGTGPGAVVDQTLTPLPIGRARQLTAPANASVALLNFGPLLEQAREAAAQLGAVLVDMRWVKPLDEALLRELAARYRLLVTVEDHQLMTGAGSAVGEFLHRTGSRVALLSLGIPDQFVHHGKRDLRLAELGLDAEGIAQAIRERLVTLDATGSIR